MSDLIRCLLFLSLVIPGLPAGAQRTSQDQSAPLLNVIGVDGTEHKLTAEEWAKLPRTTVKARDHSGAEASFEGVAARDVLRLAGAPFGQELRGPGLALYVVAEAADGYKVVYAVPEFDDGFTDGLILVADRRDGEALGVKEGPLRIVVPWEKRQGRWIRQLTVLRIRQAH
ncbi:MAG TPA: molybdopterin-dependent oxidoreductase [Burkholderiales bacterium]|nr:molybdopterin-dependent oxidoreductase [Burkholderiales bacterium]